jgi:putative nucleotidyltransferase with HDIG domain
VLLLIAASTVVVAWTGGTPNAFAHFYYLPILIAAYYFGTAGGALTGLASGLIVGPALSAYMTSSAPNIDIDWVTRLAFFVGIGVASGLLLRARARNRRRLADSLRELYQAYGRSLQTFASLVAVRDEQTSHHCERVAHNALEVGKELGLSDNELTELFWAGILHDLGKISVPARILLKTGMLTTTERAEMKKHAAVGADILIGISPRFKHISEGVRSHHEWWDGRGYPNGLKGTEIPLSGRILAIVDVFEAITSERPYRQPMTIEDALNEIRKARGSHFDPKITSTFLELYANGRIIVEGDPVPRNNFDELPLPGYATLAEDVDLG